MKKFVLGLLVIWLVFPLSGCVAKKISVDKKPAPRSVLFRQKELRAKQLVVPAFEQLPLSRKLYAYYMTQAIEAGRDIIWVQNSREGLTIRKLFETLWPYQKTLSKQKRYELTKYLFRLYRDHGNYAWRSNTKFVPENFSLQDGLSLIEQAKKQGLDAEKAQCLTSELTRLDREIFDPAYKPVFLARDGNDLIQLSNSNFYGSTVTREQFETLPDGLQRHPMSYPCLDASGNMAVSYQRIGDRFDKELREIERYLQQASAYGTPQEKTLIDLLVRVLHTADPKDFDAFNTAWVQYQAEDLDTMIGFVENYRDPLHIRGSWEGFIVLRNLNPEEQARSEAIRKNFPYFENAMPVDARFKKTGDYTIPQSQGIYLIFGAGDCGEGPFSGVNLPNNRDITKVYGSKSFTLLNVINDIGEDSKEREKENRLFYSPKYWKALRTHNFDLAGSLAVSFHEILGHGSGKLAEGLDDDTVSKLLGEMGDTIEECRAETAALFHFTDSDQLLKFGVLPAALSREEANTFCELAIITGLTSNVRGYVRNFQDDTTKISQPHLLGRQVIQNYLLENGGINAVLQGKRNAPQFEIETLEKTRTVIGNLWAELQRIRSTGDLDRAKSLFEHYGAYTDEHRAWRSALKEDELKFSAKYGIYLNPAFSLVQDAQGNITDVTIQYHTGKSCPAMVVEDQRRRANGN